MIESNVTVPASAPREAWARSSRCTPNGNCVELKITQGVIHVRDSKNGDANRLVFDREQWTIFLGTVTS